LALHGDHFFKKLYNLALHLPFVPKGKTFALSTFQAKIKKK